MGTAAYRQVTGYCDWTHPTIQHLAMEQTQQCAHDEVAKAVHLFTWVRDRIAFRVGHWNRSASETLAEESGTCTNKANLFVATCRAVSLPAGYHVVHVKGQQYLGPIVLPALRQRISRRSIHVYAAVYLQGRWVRCDPSDDRRFADSTTHLNPQSRLVEWDGLHDAVVNLDPDHILDDQGPLSTIDELMAKPARIRPAIVQLGNLYIQFLREQARSFASLDTLEPAFRTWLRGRAPLSFSLYMLLVAWHRVSALRRLGGRDGSV